MDTASLVARLEHPTSSGFNYVLSVAWSPRGDMLATGDSDGVVRLWDTATWSLLAEMAELRARRHIQKLRFSPEGDRLVSLRDNHAESWDVASRSIAWETKERVNPDLIDAAGRRIICSNFRLLDARSGKWVREKRDTIGETPIGISLDGTLIATIGPDDSTRTIIARDLASMDVVETLEVHPRGPDPSSFIWYSFKQAQNGAVIGYNEDGLDYIMNISDRPWCVAQVVTFRIVAWSADHRLVAYKSAYDSKRVNVAHAALDDVTGAIISSFTKPEDMGVIHDAAFSPDDRWLAVASDDTFVRVFSIGRF